MIVLSARPLFRQKYDFIGKQFDIYFSNIEINSLHKFISLKSIF